MKEENIKFILKRYSDIIEHEAKRELNFLTEYEKEMYIEEQKMMKEYYKNICINGFESEDKEIARRISEWLNPDGNQRHFKYDEALRCYSRFKRLTSGITDKEKRKHFYIYKGNLDYICKDINYCIESCNKRKRQIFDISDYKPFVLAEEKELLLKMMEKYDNYIKYLSNALNDLNDYKEIFEKDID